MTATIEVQEWTVAKPKKWRNLGLKTWEHDPTCFVVGIAGLPRELMLMQMRGLVREDYWIVTALDRFSGKTVSVYWQPGHPVCDMRVEVHPKGYLPFGEEAAG